MSTIFRKRQVDGHKNNGSTETKFSSLRLLFNNVSTNLKKVFSFFLPTAHFGFYKPVLAIANLAHLPLPLADAYTQAKSKKLNPPTLRIGVLRTFFARVLFAPKGAPQAYGIHFLSATKCCLTLFYKNKLGFP